MFGFGDGFRSDTFMRRMRDKYPQYHKEGPWERTLCLREQRTLDGTYRRWRLWRRRIEQSMETRSDIYGYEFATTAQIITMKVKGVTTWLP